MTSHMGNGLQAAIKALDDVVAKSIDPTNPLAREQLKLVSRYLGFVQQRLPLQHERDRYELAHYLKLADELEAIGQLSERACWPLVRQARAGGAAVLTNAYARSTDIKAAIEALTAAVSMLVRDVASENTDLRRVVERQVVAASLGLFNMQRAWYLPMGFEPDPSQVPALAAVLDEGISPST
jgi:hypothetical protein